MPLRLRPFADPAVPAIRVVASRDHHHPIPHLSDSEESDDDTEATTNPPSSARSRSSFLSFLSSRPSQSDLVLPSSNPTSARSTPLPSRAPSPFQELAVRPFLSQAASTSSSACNTDTDDPSDLPFAPRSSRKSHHIWWNDARRPWWHFGSSRSRRRRRPYRYLNSVSRSFKIFVRSYLPTSVTSIILALLVLSVFALLLTVFLMHVLNPDKEPLPWREYCSVPPPPKRPPSQSSAYPEFVLDPTASPPEFPPPWLESASPVGMFIGVFSTDQAYDRRQHIRSTYATHHHSRNGAGEGDGGRGTSRTIVRFILGKPRHKMERRIQLEMETYNDLVILPIDENMNYGKTHAFFSWASTNAWVPPPTHDAERYPVSYTNVTSLPPPLAAHDPKTIESGYDWVRPDFVIKSDDDAFVMLAELEGRLRLEMVEATRPVKKPRVSDLLSPPSSSSQDPLIYWGYLVKNRFMAGELYGLSWSIVEWIAVDSTIKGMVKGAEDKQVAKWMRRHPQAGSIRWVSEHCWMYDHPRAGTVYSHGYLFPSEVSRVQRAYKTYVQALLTEYPSLASLLSPVGRGNSSEDGLPDATYPAIYQRLSYSTVSNFGQRYVPPVPNLTPLQSVEALVEGSAMSRLRDNVALGGADTAWKQREGRKTRYQNKRLGGTVVVHFVKRNEWFLETALALLEGDEIVEGERRHQEQDTIGDLEGIDFIQKVITTTGKESSPPQNIHR